MSLKFIKRKVCRFGTYYTISYGNCRQINIYRSKYGAALLLSSFLQPLLLCVTHARKIDMSLVKDFAKLSEQATTYYSKARVGIHLLNRCCSSARPCACTANRGAQRRAHEHFYVPNSITRVSAKNFSSPLLMTTSGRVAPDLLPPPYLVSFNLRQTNLQHPAMNSLKFM